MGRLLICFSLLVHIAVAQESWRGSFRATVTHAVVARQAGELSSVRYTVFDALGNEVYIVDREVSYDVGIPAATIFESGALMLVDAFHAQMEYYDNRGELTARFQPLKDSQPDHERIVVVSAHDSVAAVLISESMPSSALLLVVSDHGVITLERSLEGHHAMGVQFSPDGSHIAASTFSWSRNQLSQTTHFLSRSGNLRGSVPLGFRTGIFSSDNSAFLCFTNRKAALVSLSTILITWNYEVKSRLILDIEWDEEGAVILTSEMPTLKDSQWHYWGANVEIVRQDGQRHMLRGIPSSEFTLARLKRIKGETHLELDKVIYPLR